MKPSKILRKAKKLMWDGYGEPPDWNGKNQFICNAVVDAVDDWKDADQITNYIESLLDGDSVEVWLTKQGYIRADLYLDLPEKIQVQVQSYRQRWMNHLIKQYEEQGL